MQDCFSLSRFSRLLVLAGLLGLAACSPAENPSAEIEVNSKSTGLYNSVAEQFTQKILLPGFADHAAAATALEQVVSTQCEDGAINETALKSAWTDAFLSWQKTNFLLFGPLTEERALRLQFYPDKRQLVPARVQQLLQNPTTISAEKIASGTAPIQGYPALEQLIFAVPSDTANRCKLLSAISAFVATQAERLSADWQQQAGAFAANGKEAVGRTVDSLQRVVNRLHERRLAEPLGLRNGAERQPEPQTAEAAAAQQSLPAILATVESMQRWLTGPNGLPALADDEAGRQYFAKLDATFSTLIEDITAEKLPLEKAVVEQAAGLLALHAGSLSALKNQLGELNTVLNVYTGFNADDGD